MKRLLRGLLMAALTLWLLAFLLHGVASLLDAIALLRE